MKELKPKYKWEDDSKKRFVEALSQSEIALIFALQKYFSYDALPKGVQLYPIYFHIYVSIKKGLLGPQIIAYNFDSL